jgi:hypothetical protein
MTTYNFDPGREYTKREIAEFTGLSANTITDSLKTAGLSTSKRAYTGRELLERFVLVRRMLEAGRSHDEVRAALRMREARQEEAEERVREPADGLSTETAAHAFHSLDVEIAEGVKTLVSSIVEEAAKDIMPYVPAMVAIALSKEAERGTLKEGFQTTLRRYFAERRALAFDAIPAHAEALPEPEAEEGGLDYSPRHNRDVPTTDTVSVEAERMSDHQGSAADEEE